MPMTTGIAWRSRRIRYFVIWILPSSTVGRARWRGSEGRGARGAGAPRLLQRQVIGRLPFSRSALQVPVEDVPRRAGERRVGEVVPQLAADEIHVLPIVERDLDRLLDVDLLERGHGVLDDAEVHAVLDGLKGL